MSVPSSLPPLFEGFPPVSTKAWEAKIQEDLGTSDPGSVLEWTSIEGISLPAYRRREDLEALPHVSEDTSASPLVDASAQPANQWRIRQDLCHPDAHQAGRLARAAVQGGCTDLGLTAGPGSPYHPDAVPDTPSDLQHLLREVPLSETHLHLDRGPAALLLLGLLRAADDGQFHAPLDGGSVAYDPVAALATGAMRDESAAFDWLVALLEALPSPEVRTVTVDVRPYHEAGASAVQELGYALGALSEILATLLERGHSLSRIVPRLQVVGATSTSYFLEIAKLRALRLLVPQVLEAYAEEVDQPLTVAPTDVQIQIQTSRRTETIYDPYVNMLRATTEAMAAVIGGCDVLSVRAYDACFRPPDRFGTRIARNVQLILRHEAHFDVVADPAAGSYYLETATHRLAERAWSTFQHVEARGGLLDMLQDGYVQREIAEVREHRQHEVDNRSRVLVGTNHYPNLDEEKREVSTCNNGDQASDELDRASLNALTDALRAGRDSGALLRGFRRGPAAVDPLPSIRVAEGIEAVRRRTERHAEQTGHTPVVLLAPFGPPGPRSARATFARNVLGVAGFDVREHLGFASPAEAVEAAVDTDPDIVVICSGDDEYADLVPAARTALQKAGQSPLLVVAGNPDTLSAGVSADAFLHRHLSLREKLESIQRQLGIQPD